MVSKFVESFFAFSASDNNVEVYCCSVLHHYFVFRDLLIEMTVKGKN